MTLAPHRTPLAFSDVEDVAKAIRADGGRLSSACRLVLEALIAAEGPVSAEYIAEARGGRTTRMDVSSVYRNLERLEELGAVRHVHVGHGPGLYALEGDTRLEYLVCERCDRVDAVDAARLDRVREEVRKESGYEARFSHFPIVGLCGPCAEAKDVGLHAHVHRHAHGDGDDHGHDQPEHAHGHSHGHFVHSHGHVHND